MSEPGDNPPMQWNDGFPAVTDEALLIRDTDNAPKPEDGDQSGVPQEPDSVPDETAELDEPGEVE